MIVKKGVTARSQDLGLLRLIDDEIEKIKAGVPDPELKARVATLEGQLTDHDKVLQEHAGVVEKLRTENEDAALQLKVENETRTQKLQTKLEDEQKASEILATANSQLKADVDQANALLKIEKDKVAELESANSDLKEQIADIQSAGSDPADEPEIIDPDDTPADSKAGAKDAAADQGQGNTSGSGK